MITYFAKGLFQYFYARKGGERYVKDIADSYAILWSIIFILLATTAVLLAQLLGMFVPSFRWKTALILVLLGISIGIASFIVSRWRQHKKLEQLFDDIHAEGVTRSSASLFATRVLPLILYPIAVFILIFIL